MMNHSDYVLKGAREFILGRDDFSGERWQDEAEREGMQLFLRMHGYPTAQWVHGFRMGIGCDPDTRENKIKTQLAELIDYMKGLNNG